MPTIYALLSSWLMVWMPIGVGHWGAVAAAPWCCPSFVYAGDADRADGVDAQGRSGACIHAAAIPRGRDLALSGA